VARYIAIASYIQEEIDVAKIVNRRDSKTQRPKVPEQTSKDRESVNVKPGKPNASVVARKPIHAVRKLGFMAGQGIVAADIKQDFAADIASMLPSPKA
jgi:hypothetical protein